MNPPGEGDSKSGNHNSHLSLNHSNIHHTMDHAVESDDDYQSDWSESSSGEASTSFVPFTPPAVVLSGGRARQVSEDSSGGRTKKWVCDYPGCDKSYSRPVRLEEHQRSHTGEVSRVVARLGRVAYPTVWLVFVAWGTTTQARVADSVFPLSAATVRLLSLLFIIHS